MELVLRDVLLVGIAVAAAFRIRDLVLDEETPAPAERRFARKALTAMKILIAILIVLTLFDLGRALL